MKVLFATAPFYADYPFLHGGENLDVNQPNKSHDNPLLSSYLLPIILRDYGCQVDVIFDLGLRLAEDPDGLLIQALNADLICLSATSFNWSCIKEFIEFIDRVKDHPPQIVGGVHPTLVPEHVMHSSLADIAVIGEGEKTILELIDHFRGKRSLEDVHGIYYRRDGKILSTPKRQLLSSEELGHLPIIQWNTWDDQPAHLSVQTSRGCLMDCTFCSVPFRHSWRPFPVQHVLDSLEACSKGSTHVQHIAFADDCFTPNQQFATQLLSSVTAFFPRIRMHIEARVRDLLKPGYLELMAETNVQSIGVGVECGYDAGLKKITKGLKIEEVEELGRRARALDLGDAFYYSYIIGFPWETSAEIKATIDFAFSLADRFGGFMQVCWWLPMPGSRLFQQLCKDYGLDESMFDRMGWWFDRGVFMRTHPKLTVVDIYSLLDYCHDVASVHKHIKKGGSAFISHQVGTSKDLYP